MRAFVGMPVLAVLFAAGFARGAPDETAVRAELTRVYERPEFRTTENDFAAQFRDALLRFFAKLGSLHAVSPVLFWIVLCGCIVLLVLLLGHIIWTITRAVFVGRRARVDRRAEERRRLSANYRNQADESAAVGEFTEAVRLLFLSLVYAFDEAGRVPFQPSLTNREYLHFFDDRPAVADNLRVFVDLLDDNWYGQHDTGSGQYEDCRALFDRLREEG